MKQTAISGWMLLFFLSLMTGACSVRSTDPLILPYQEALQAYYSGLETGQLEPALEKATKAVNEAPDDLSARMLRAQIYLMQYRRLSAQSGNETVEVEKMRRKQQMLSDLRIIQETLDQATPEEDWIAPRLYTTMGDLFLLEGKDRLSIAEKSRNKGDAWRVQAYFNAAASYFAAALQLADSPEGEASSGRRKEFDNAVNGSLQAAYGRLEAVSMIKRAYGIFDNDESPMARNLETDRIRDIESARLLLDGKTETVEAVPLNQLPLDADYHADASRLLTLVTTTQMNALEALCRDGSAEKEKILDTQADLKGDLLLMAAHRAINLALLPEGKGDPNFPTVEMEKGYERDAKEPCPAD